MDLREHRASRYPAACPNSAQPAASPLSNEYAPSSESFYQPSGTLAARNRGEVLRAVLRCAPRDLCAMAPCHHTPCWRRGV